MIGNPEESIAFVNKLAEHYDRRKRVYVSLQNIKRIDYDAIVVLLAILIRFKAAKIGFNGDFPQDESAREILLKSRFFESLYRKFADQAVYRVGSENAIHTHANKSVDPTLSARIIEKASESVWGKRRRCQGIQRIFMELMQNTNNHASFYSQGDKHWWVSVNHRPKDKRVFFTFVDFGVGVFRSLDNKTVGSKWFAWRTKLGTLLRRTDNAEVLELILAGVLHQTVTGKQFRGKGLPGIKEVLDRQGVSNLFIITNNVYADISKNSYRLMGNEFGGTLVSWELDQSNLSTAYDDAA